MRIEDTDQERSTEESIEQILEAMRWLGLDWDEYARQTERTHAHQRASQELLERGSAYEHEGALWFRVPQAGETIVHDQLLGDVSFANQQLKDFVIRRSDGSFVYNFVVVVDDADMQITHVIRGDDHLNNTPKQILLYKALKRPLPQFAHLPMILGPDRTRLSKRHGVTSVLEYRQRGFLPESMINFLARLGWSYGDREIFTRDELVELFSLESVGSSAAVFEESKLRWLNQHHLKTADPHRIIQIVEPLVPPHTAVTKAMWDKADPERLLRGVILFRDRCETLVHLAKWMAILFPVPIDREQDILLDDKTRALMEVVLDALQRLERFTPQAVEDTIRSTLNEHGATLKDVAATCRMAITGQKAGPGLFDTIALIGQETTVSRLRALPEGKIP